MLLFISYPSWCGQPDSLQKFPQPKNLDDFAWLQAIQCIEYFKSSPYMIAKTIERYPELPLLPHYIRFLMHTYTTERDFKRLIDLKNRLNLHWCNHPLYVRYKDDDYCDTLMID